MKIFPSIPERYLGSVSPAMSAAISIAVDVLKAAHRKAEKQASRTTTPRVQRAAKGTMPKYHKGRSA